VNAVDQYNEVHVSRPSPWLLLATCVASTCSRCLSGNPHCRTFFLLWIALFYLWINLRSTSQYIILLGHKCLLACPKYCHLLPYIRYLCILVKYFTLLIYLPLAWQVLVLQLSKWQPHCNPYLSHLKYFTTCDSFYIINESTSCHFWLISKDEPSVNLN
jgi:hypothetical protein